MNKLTPEQEVVLRKGATEPAFSSELLHNKKSGSYKCAYCGAILFSSDEKYDSGSGWPSFHSSVDGAVSTRADYSLGMVRQELLCRECKSHLGHVFDDGPKGNRFCVNGLALSFEKKKD